jgi:sulfur-oxidizing protein SoxX
MLAVPFRTSASLERPFDDSRTIASSPRYLTSVISLVKELPEDRNHPEAQQSSAPPGVRIRIEDARRRKHDNRRRRRRNRFKRKPMNRLNTVVVSGVAVALVVVAIPAPRAADVGEEQEKAKAPLEEGRALAIEYCQACHYFEGTEQAGTVGPPFVAMKPRFPERRKLEQRIYDPQAAANPYTMMPPFGRNGLLDEQKIKLVVDFLYTL